MSSRLADRLNLARHRRFAGRSVERALFQTALTATELPFFILYMHGPGGVGKTSLMGEFAYLCSEHQVPVVRLDARSIDPSPETFLTALQTALNLSPPHTALEHMTSWTQRHAILIDTYEKLAPLDAWLREIFLPQLPADVLVVMSGQHPPAPAWTADAGWQSLIHILPLRNFSPEESRTYLTLREVPPKHFRAILDFTYGHPLALSLVADVFAQRHDTLQVFKPEAAPDIIKVLLEQLVQKVPGPAHRAALEACALVHLTTEALLAAMLAMPDVHELFDWLRGLSCIEAGSAGLFPHDLARETLAADLRWRNPDWYAQLHDRARTYYANRLQGVGSQEQQAILMEYLYLHRDNPVVRPFFLQLQAQGADQAGLLTDIARPTDWPLLAEMLHQFEGPESAQLAQHWFQQQPQSVLVLRDAKQQPAGFVMSLALQQADAESLARDPATRAVWGYLQRHAPLRMGECATLFRFWLARDSYQAVSSVQSHIFIAMVQHYLTTSSLAFTFLPCRDPDFWQPIFTYADLVRLPEADFELGGYGYGVYGHDWRTMPPLAWLDLLAEREIATSPQATLPPPPKPALVVLSQPEFKAAVRDLLRDFRATRPDTLRYNPLLWSRLVAEQAGLNADEARRISTLQGIVKEAVDRLQDAPRQRKLYQALHHTYFHPAPTQEQAAELLDLPFSTFRRHLKTGVDHLTQFLWQREIGGLEM